MILTAIRIRKLKSTGNFEHCAVEAEALVIGRDDPETIRAELSAWIDSAIAQEQKGTEYRRQAQAAMEDASYWQNERNRLKEDYERISKLLRASDAFVDAARVAGLSPPDELLSDQIPF